MRKLVTIAATAAAVAFAFAGGSGATAQKAAVRATLKEFKVTPVPARVKPGVVIFSVNNAGALDHEFVVLKTNLAPSKLPKKGSKAVEVGRVGKIGPVRRGQTTTLILNLKAGKYVLLCNVSGHYGAGQFAGFTVG